ncbi:peroxiredoxin [Helicobacter sp. 11S02629-2]|uniref:peroxiredoxin n=1 Tax=Helicobacter sp. 11S02629-2 TaxID=1476195 RepID=UPI000BA769BA|nr:peroxiredoxin [Helicobacter sp. 11S02629-2]PAF45604.1 peroxiredoxin [Helicobacter sp. 11S02629-2]
MPVEKKQLKPGDLAPNFELPNSDNVNISLQDFAGFVVVLYFYPKDNTPGCTLEATDFTGLKAEFAAKGAIVIGVSKDSPASHQKFIDSKSLDVVLLSDKDNAVAKKYHAFGKKMMYGKEVEGVIRSTFIIKDGKVDKAFYNVKTKGHALEVLNSI